MAGVFDIELHDCETVEVDDSDDAIEIEEVNKLFKQLYIITLLKTVA